MSTFEPWKKYPSLLRERLVLVVEIIRRVRRETIPLHDAVAGGTAWSLGCWVYELTCHAIREAAKTNSWLSILPEVENLRFSFAIGQIPFRFYRGKPDELPERFASPTYGELHHIQTSFDIDGLRPPDRVLRLAVETDATRQVSQVTLVETDEAGNILNTYDIPSDFEANKVAPLRVEAVELPPVDLEPQEKPTEKQVKKANERKLASE